MKVLIALPLLLVAFAGCTDDGAQYTVPDQDDEGNYIIEMRPGNVFVPKRAEVPVGATVVWQHVDPGIPHNAVSNDGEFSSPTMNRGDAFNHTFEEAGDFPYKCTFHPGMEGTIRVA